MAARAQWDASLYGANTAHHRAFDDYVLAPLRIEPADHVLDLGSGSGDLTATLASRVPAGGVLGVDASAPLIEASRQHFGHLPNASFLCLDAERLHELSDLAAASGVLPPPYDLVVTVATLHWVPGPAHPALYRAIADLLRPGGVFRADFGGKGQLADTRAVLDEESARLGGETTPWYFPAPDEVLPNLIAAGFSIADGFVRLTHQTRSMPDLGAFIGFLDSQVLIAYRPSLGERFAAFRERAIARLETSAKRGDGSYDQPYVRLDLLATKVGPAAP